MIAGRASTAGGVGAWQLLGSTVYNGGGGGFGSAITSIPSMPSPPPPPPKAPPGFKAYFRHGYFPDFYTPSTTPVTTVEGCAKLCVTPPKDAPQTRCLGFEVYSPAPTGNCYLFFEISKPFFELAPCATYLRDRVTVPEHVHLDTAQPAAMATKAAAPNSMAAQMRVGPDLALSSVFAKASKSHIAPFFKTQNRDLGCVLHPSTVQSRCWVQNTS